MKSALLLVCVLVVGAYAVINPSQATLNANDITALNYALTLEYLELAFYTKYQAEFSALNFSAAGYGQPVYEYLGLVLAHEQAHVTALQGAIAGKNGTAVVACTYNFGNITTVQQYLAQAQMLEAVGVSAYDGAINTIYDAGLQQVAATIATVEARHAAYLNLLNATSPFFDAGTAFDPTRNATTVASVIAPILVRCNTPVPLPVIEVVIPVTAPAGSPANPTNYQVTTNDLNALNYALFLEHLEATFYATYQNNYSRTDFANAGYAPNIYDLFTIIAAHEQAHVTALSSVITGRGGSPIAACTYNFNVNNVSDYVAHAQVFENVGVTAYDGAVNTIYDASLKEIAATIATIEARHASFLNNLTGAVPFPSNFDTANPPATIAQTVAPFLNSCPSSPVYPVYTRVYPYNNGTASTSTSGTSTGTHTSTSTSGTPATLPGLTLVAVFCAAAAAWCLMA